MPTEPVSNVSLPDSIAVHLQEAKRECRHLEALLREFPRCHLDWEFRLAIERHPARIRHTVGTLLLAAYAHRHGDHKPAAAQPETGGGA